jgi:hypothetical protein
MAEASELDRATLLAERETLARKAHKRRDMKGFAQNVAEIEQRIAEIDAALAAEPTA